MNPKKVVEVEHLAYFISQLARREEVGLIADLGAGQGYLSRTLVYQYDHPVLAIDSNQIQTCGAERQLQRTEKFVNKTKKPLSASGDQISPGDAPTNSPAPQPWLVCGLHACGNLSNVMLKWFVKSTAKCVVNVGCCYNMMGLTEGTISYCPFFPISQELTHKGATLSVNALKLACQAPTRWADQTTTAIGNFERHYFRALLHYAMVDRGLVQPNDPFPVVGRLSKTAFANFSTYAQRALPHHGPAQLSNSPLKVGDLAYYDTKLRPQAARMAIVWTLKALLSPCIESLIILDRCLYLVEQGCQVDLVPLVDPNVSPRNIVIMATK
ncbi:methyltransferase domain-containing protein [Dimargaris cristalligena]|uniref:Methyltransferase domain-containing protein n=1 Tax=Dimargaris cristalligena TaxID=215637 RepID=A0A4V1J5J6_9FUNG|nr:methyltransferase domain-containing protein [Dimargaris cristalligena]|eukprot:RKP39289.1 methyltransferase domain-containing protein [Dimargaris cristalligena]